MRIPAAEAADPEALLTAPLALEAIDEAIEEAEEAAEEPDAEAELARALQLFVMMLATADRSVPAGQDSALQSLRPA